jgi:hypothetical protein
MHALLEPMLAERRALRDELVQLKSCQVRYFALSLAATGALVGWGASTQTGNAQPSPVFLAPLVVLLPSWSIFFDKATTITRIVGYYRHLEAWIAADESGSEVHYRGWERALRSFREYQREKQTSMGRRSRASRYVRELITGCRELVLPTTAHRYWVINWHTFFLLSVVCWVLGANVWEPGRTHLSMPAPWAWPFLALIVLTSLHMAYLVGSLTRGRHSYDRNEEMWTRVFSDRDA